MKTLTFKPVLALFLFAVIMLASCKKDAATIEEGLTGIWTGAYKPGDSDYFLRANFIAGGTIQILSNDNVLKASGTWKLEGLQIYAEYKYGQNSIYKFKGVYNHVTQKITGWQGEDDDFNSPFYLNKD